MKPKILEKVVFLDHLMGYFGSEGIYDSNLSFWGKKLKKNFWTQRNFWRMHQLQNVLIVNKSS